MVCITQHLQPLPYDPGKDFVPVARAATSWIGMGINPEVPANNLQEFIAYAKANPGKINFGSAGLATITQLYGEMFNIEAGVKMVHVPYKGSAPATQDLLSGQIQVQFDPTTLPHIAAGRLKCFAILGEKRWPGKPDIPTLKEQGLGKIGGDAWYGILAAKGTPQVAIDKLAKAIGEAVQDPAIEREAGDQRQLRELPGSSGVRRHHRARARLVRRDHQEGRHQGLTTGPHALPDRWPPAGSCGARTSRSAHAHALLDRARPRALMIMRRTGTRAVRKTMMADLEVRAPKNHEPGRRPGRQTCPQRHLGTSGRPSSDQ